MPASLRSERSFHAWRMNGRHALSGTAKARSERLGLVIARRQKDREDCAQALAEREFEDAHASWARACNRTARQSEQLSDRLTEAARAAADLAKLRAAADEARSRAAELNPHGAGLDWPADADECDWLDVTQLLELVTAGPRQPKRRSDEAIAKGEVDRASINETLIRDVVRRALTTPPIGETHNLIFSSIEEPLRSEARRRYEAEIARERERRAAAAAAAD